MLESPDLKLLLSLKKKKKLPIIKCSTGIGDTDGFPALDASSEAYSVPEDHRWGFRITGGSEFHMPLTVFQVSDDGLAYKGGIRLGDIILKINDVDATNLTLAQAHALIDEAYDKLHLIARKMDEEKPVKKEGEEGEEDEEKPIEEKSVVMRRPMPPKIPEPPKDKARIEERLRAMQRKLSEIAEIPLIIQSTLQTISNTFGRILPSERSNENYNFYSDNDDSNDDDIDKESEIQNDFDDNESNDDNADEDESDEDDNTLSTDSLDSLSNKQNITSEFYHVSKQYQIESDNDNDDDDDESSNDENMPQLNNEEDDELELIQEPTEEELIKQQKKEKIQQLEQSWPWGDRQKSIYRESTCHLVPKLDIVESRIKQLDDGKFMQLYRRKSESAR